MENYRLFIVTFRNHPIWVQYWIFRLLILIIPLISLLKLSYRFFGLSMGCLQILLDSLTNFICSSLINPNDQTWHPVYEIWNGIITHFWAYSSMNQLFQIGCIVILQTCYLFEKMHAIGKLWMLREIKMEKFQCTNWKC